jgi:hypothetical protein
MDLRQKDMTFKRKMRRLDRYILSLAYRELTEALNAKYPEQAKTTRTEDEFAILLRESTKLEFERSFWIGNLNLDFFFAAIRSSKHSDLERLSEIALSPIELDQISERTFTGMAIEIDGDIHNKYFKLMKDQNKYEVLHRLSISLVCIENQDLNHPTVTTLLESLSGFKRLDHRAKSRLLRNIYLFTIIRHKKLILTQSLPKCLSVLKHIGEI